MAVALALIPVAYLVGTFPTAQLVGRAHGIDVMVHGSGNPGASNIYRLLGRGPAALVFVADIAKGTLPALAGVLVWDHMGGYALGVAAVVGHVYPVMRRFKGGRGVATAAGMAAVLYPVPFAVLVPVFFVLSWLTHRASVGSIAVAVGLPILVGLGDHAGWEVGAVAAMAVLVIGRHSANLRRLLHGQELRLDLEDGSRDGAPRDSSPPPDAPDGQTRGAA